MNNAPKVRLATVWLDGCSGCHMSFLDLDERLLEVFQKVDLVYSPLVDTKDYPENVDVVLIEGAVSSPEDLHKLEKIRKNTKVLIALGDCSVTSNVPSMRNRFKLPDLLDQVYVKNVTCNPQIPTDVIPPLFKHARPVHEFVKVDVFVPGCPPESDTIHFLVTELLEGRIPDLTGKTHFGA